MRRIIYLLLMCSIGLTSLTGCYDASEVSDWGYVYSIGIEKGVTDKIRMTIQVPSMKSGKSTGGQQGGGKGQGEIETISIDCPTFYSGINMVNSFLSRRLNYMHAKYLVFSESLAREGIDGYITAFIRGRQIRRKINVIITKGSASQFLDKITTVVSSSLTRKQENLLSRWEDTGFFCDATYGDMINDAKSLYGQPIAILASVNDESKYKEGEGTGEVQFKSSGDHYAGELVRKGASNVELFGTAVFNGGKMVGELNGDETRALLMVRGEFQRGFFAAKDPKKPDGTISMDIRRQKAPGIKVRFKDGKPFIDVKVFLEGDILGLQSTIDYESIELKPVMENVYIKLIKEQIDKTVKKCQKMDADVFKLGYAAAMHFLTVPEWEEYNWNKRFRDAEVNTQVYFKVRRTGTMISSAEFASSEGKKGE